MNKFDQLVEDLTTNRITHNQLQIAYRESLRQSKHLPVECKSILCGDSATNTGLVYKMFKIINETIGGFELAIRRAKDK